MGRRRIKNVELPEGVHPVRSKGRIYYYYQPGRGTARALKRVKLFGDPFAPVGTAENERFWRELNHVIAQREVTRQARLRFSLIDIRRTTLLGVSRPAPKQSTACTLIGSPSRMFGECCQLID
jgi:hypothetical protein